MKHYLATAVFLCAAPAMAQTAAPAPAPVAAAASPAAPAAPAAGALSADTPVEQLMASPASKEALLKTFPKLDENPAYDQFKALSIRQLAQMLGGAIPEEKVAQLDKDLAALK